MTEQLPANPGATVSGPFWSAVRSHSLKVQQCDICGHSQHPPRIFCINCGGRQLSFRDANGLGTIYSFTVVHRAFVPELAHRVPYALALVEMEGGLRMLGRIADCEHTELEIGQDVEIDYEELTEAITLPVFRLRQA